MGIVILRHVFDLARSLSVHVLSTLLQIGVGYQHKKVIRQRTVGSAGVGQRVVDMSAAPTPTTSERRKRRPSHSKNGHREVDSDVDGAEKDKPKKSRKSANKKSKSKKRKKEKEENSGKAKKVHPPLPPQ